jgi:hypothetical protein
MGYDLHITRRTRWFDSGRDITANEWLAYVAADPELVLQPGNSSYFALCSGDSQLDQPWLDWADGQICTKYPDSSLITKMVAIAQAFGATVQGDDGEIYSSGADAPRQPRLSLRERLAEWLGSRRSSLQAIPQQAAPFHAGDRVRDIWGNTHTVVEVDPAAMHGTGIIRTRSDNTGTQLSRSMRAHGLSLLDDTHHNGV